MPVKKCEIILEALKAYNKCFCFLKILSVQTKPGCLYYNSVLPTSSELELEMFSDAWNLRVLVALCKHTLTKTMVTFFFLTNLLAVFHLFLKE